MSHERLAEAAVRVTVARVRAKVVEGRGGGGGADGGGVRLLNQLLDLPGANLGLNLRK